MPGAGSPCPFHDLPAFPAAVGITLPFAPQIGNAAVVVGRGEVGVEADGLAQLFAAGGNTATAALETAAANGAYVIGSETDLYANLTNLRPMLLTSAVNDVRLGVFELVRQAHGGHFPSGERTGNVGLAPWHDLDRQISPDVKEEMEKIKIRLEVGTISLNIPYDAP